MDVLLIKNNAAQKGAKVFSRYCWTGVGTSKPIYLEAGGYSLIRIAPRAGDVITCYADASKAKEVLGWAAKNLDDMVRDSHGTGKRKSRELLEPLVLFRLN